MELEGIEYGLGSLISAVAGQCCRFRRKPRGVRQLSIKEGKINKFLRDKSLRDKRETMFRIKTLNACQQSINASTADSVSET